jgi:hypothetical protein
MPTHHIGAGRQRDLRSYATAAQNAMNAGDGATIEQRIRVNQPDEGEEDARVQERGICAKISLSACSSPQYFQRATAFNQSADP